MMKGTKLTVAVTALAVVLVVGFTYAGHAWGGRGGGFCGGTPAMFNDLTPEQQKQARALHIDFMKKTQPMNAELDKKKIDMVELTSKDQVDEGAVTKKREEIWALKDQVRTERRALQTKFRSLLTPEQRKKMGPLGLGMGPGHGKGMGRHMMMGQGMGCPGCPFAGKGGGPGAGPAGDQSK
jgi:Spy/CpxP family protein refolding chaperone